MAINTFGTLKAAVSNWLARSDLDADLGTIVSLAEANIRRDVRCRAMEQVATGTLSAATLALPTRFLEARRVQLGGEVQNYMNPNEWTLYEESSSGVYTIIGEEFHFQSSSAGYVINYWQAFAPFTDDGDTNWLIENAPDVYLWASLEQAAIYIMDQAYAGMAAQQYQKALQRLNVTEQKARFGGPLFVRPQLTGVETR